MQHFVFLCGSKKTQEVNAGELWSFSITVDTDNKLQDASHGSLILLFELAMCHVDSSRFIFLLQRQFFFT